jgi:beta-lactamase regulating signal transducer with metallopeptidase domain
MATNPYDFHAIARLAAGGLLNSLVAGVAVALLAWALTILLRRHGSGTRFAVWFLALVAIVVLPWAGSVVASKASVAALDSRAVTLPESVAPVLFIAWFIGATLGLSHVALGLYRLRRLRATCMPVEEEDLEPGTRAIIVEAQRHRCVTLCTSDAVRVPAAIGYFRPLVIFPSWALVEIPPAEFNAILMHELAHLRRYDDWSNLAQKIAKAIFFFHPAVWFIESRLTLEREMACDDAVLAAQFSPRAYAESLVSLAEKSFLRRGVQLAQAAIGHVQQLKTRLTEILRKDRSPQGSAGIRKPVLALMSLAAIVATCGISRAPRLIAFSAGTDTIAAVDARVLSPATDFHPQPVSLRYTEHSQPAIHHLPATKAHLTRSTVPSVRPVLVHRAALAPMSGEMQALLLADFPMELAPTPVLVVFRGEQFGPDGPVFWQVTVVHLTPAQQRAITGGVPKQI